MGSLVSRRSIGFRKDHLVKVEEVTVDNQFEDMLTSIQCYRLFYHFPVLKPGRVGDCNSARSINAITFEMELSTIVRRGNNE